MPAKPDLPVELTAELQSVESLLRGFSPVDSEINRDATLYEAGWAAAMMQARGGTHWVWPATSAVLAASVLVMGSFLVRSTGKSSEIVVTEVAAPQITKEQVANERVTNEKGLLPVVPEPEPVISRWTHRSPFLAMRDRALRMEFDEPVSYAGIDDDNDTPKAVTARELMLELLGETS